MKKVILFLGILVILFFVACSAKNNVNCVEGKVIDATMNTVTILTNESKKLSFGLAEFDKTKADSYKLEDMIKICYKGEMNDVDTSNVEVTKIINITPKIYEVSITTQNNSYDGTVEIMDNGLKVLSRDGNYKKVFKYKDIEIQKYEGEASYYITIKDKTDEIKLSGLYDDFFEALAPKYTIK